ncbi:hypothetical protein P0O24_09745 [Methanotrichaceae archaeon M04Ac]|uniref:DUF2141 domain-containing protein n=1 Tax=Candidatus Methanocrinis alkalitolerans TaxID=3033395 RepID=A0ABT5XGP5_9EURY|nr:hypothetical protein [Candidatus Methanocrinis alkalitolerans]MDF0593861.1 hypothetical protein [Candidatus Methanocrinis alkalitolerans]
MYQRSACFFLAALLCIGCMLASAEDSGRPATGTFVIDTLRSGHGVLVVENNNPLGDDLIRDGVAVLTTEDKVPLVAVYVREGESFEIEGIEDGVYDFYFTVGNVWNGESANFSDAEFYRTESPLPFETEIDGRDLIFTIWTLTLEEVPGGNEDKIPVPREEFPDLKEN